jgi:ubiquitin-protein ligase
MEPAKRIEKEFKDISKHPNMNMGYTIGLFDEDDIYQWRVTFIGPKDSSYCDGLFNLKIIFPKNYPKSGPEIIFLTPIYHLNVKYFKESSDSSEQLGHVNANFLNDWKPETTIFEILIKLYAIFYKTNPDSCYDNKNFDRRNEFINNRTLYDSKAKYFTKKYASPFARQYWKEKVNVWDFSFENTPQFNLDIKKIKKEARAYSAFDDKDNNIINLSILDSKKRKTIIQCRKNDLISDVVLKYSLESGKDINDMILIYNARSLKLEDSVGMYGIHDKSSINAIDHFKGIIFY